MRNMLWLLSARVAGSGSAVKLGVVILPPPRPKTAGKHPFNDRGRACSAIVHF